METPRLAAPSTHFPLAELPGEVRDKIIAHELCLGPLMEVPALLIVLGTCKTWNNDYKEAQRMYRIQNHVVKVSNQEEFKTMNRKKRMAIRYLKLDAQQINTNPPRYLNLRNARAFCLNNFETLTIDLTGGNDIANERGAAEGFLRELFCSVDYMRTASSHGVRTIYVIMDPGLSTENGWRLALGPGRQKKMLTEMNGKSVELITWQRNEGRVPVRVCQTDRFRHH